MIEARAHQPDAAIVDLGLPDLDGLEVIRAIRAWSMLPILVLSARSLEGQKVAALDAGADDVISGEDGSIEVLTPPTEFEAVKLALEKAGLKPEVAEVTMRAEAPIELAGDDAARMQKLLDVIEDLDDVQDVYHNAEIAE